MSTFPNGDTRGAASDVTANSRGQVNRRARSTKQTSAASTRDLTRTLRAGPIMSHETRLAPCSFLMCGGASPAPLTGSTFWCAGKNSGASG